MLQHVIVDFLLSHNIKFWTGCSKWSRAKDLHIWEWSCGQRQY